MNMMPDWDQAYAIGKQDGAGETKSSPRFALIGGFCTQAGASEVLDIGCGSGLLRASLCPRLSRYTGLDSSSVAIQRLQDKGGGDFICADAEHWIPSRQYHAVILNEVVYYFKDPLSALAKYYAALSPGGIFIVSIFKRRTSFWQANPNRRAIEIVENFLTSASRYEVLDGKGTWVVFVCQK
jgi:2-polyprenyl-6-hydroxyphenyl methylase/3-demethylubiquinone-9 3-methyltransferase